MMSPSEPEKLHKQSSKDNKIIDFDEYISHTTLWYELKAIKDHELKHVKKEIEDVKEFTRENRREFNGRMDKIDVRLWGIMLLSLSTLLGIVASILWG